jgi:hypothetical protein
LLLLQQDAHIWVIFRVIGSRNAFCSVFSCHQHSFGLD